MTGREAHRAQVGDVQGVVASRCLGVLPWPALGEPAVGNHASGSSAHATGTALPLESRKVVMRHARVGLNQAAGDPLEDGDGGGVAELSVAGRVGGRCRSPVGAPQALALQ